MKWMIILVVLVVGCTATSNGPVIDPNAVTSGEAFVEAIANTGKAMAPLWPAGGMIGTGIAGWLAMWKKGKKPLMEAQTAAEVNYATGSTIVWAIEQLKQSNPKAWEVLKGKISGIQADIGSEEQREAVKMIIQGMIDAKS